MHHGKHRPGSKFSATKHRIKSSLKNLTAVIRRIGVIMSKTHRARGTPVSQCAKYVLSAVALAILVACGGGGSDSPSIPAAQPSQTQPFANKAVAYDPGNAKARAFAAGAAVVTPAAAPFGVANAADASEQLFAFAKKDYAVYFKGCGATQQYLQYTYQYCSETGNYLGVVTSNTVAAGVAQDSNVVLGGVYVMGKDFGPNPMYVGMLVNYITPTVGLHYSELVFAGTGTLPMKVTRNANGSFTIERTVNKTSYQTGFYPLFNCAYYNDNFFVDGRKLWNCTAASDTIKHNVQLNPVTNEFSDYTGNDAPALNDPKWVAIQPLHPNGKWSAYATVSTGTYYHGDDTANIDFQDLAGIVSIVKSGNVLDPTESVRFLAAFSN